MVLAPTRQVINGNFTSFTIKIINDGEKVVDDDDDNSSDVNFAKRWNRLLFKLLRAHQYS